MTAEPVQPLAQVVTLRRRSRTADAAAEMPERAALASERDRLQRLVKLQADLVASIAHDLRTPLTSVLGWTELLLSREMPRQDRERALRIINAEMRRFANLIDELYDAELIANGRAVLSLEPFDVGDLLREQVELFREQSAAHTLRLDLAADDLVVRADRGRIARVVANLLSNAIKYSPGGGAVTLTARVGRESVRVAVADDGVGISAEQRHLVFAKYFRADATTTEIEGAGLGLALCRQIVDAHGGALGFESAHGEGSTFWFELRRDAATAI